MKMKPDKDLVMRDFAHADTRSVRAGLEGRDDGRVERYERYFQEHLASRQEMGVMEVFQAGFRAAHDERYEEERPLLNAFLMRLLPVLGLVFGAALANMLT